MLISAKNQVQCDFGHLKATGQFLTKKIGSKIRNTTTCHVSLFHLVQLPWKNKLYADEENV